MSGVRGWESVLNKCLPNMEKRRSDWSGFFPAVFVSLVFSAALAYRWREGMDFGVIYSVSLFFLVSLFVTWLLWRLLDPVRSLKQELEAWVDVETRPHKISNALETLKTLGLTALVVVGIVVVTAFLTGDDFAEERGTVTAVLLLVLWGVWNVGKWALLAAAAYFIGRKALDFLARRVAHYLRRYDN